MIPYLFWKFAESHINHQFLREMNFLDSTFRDLSNTLFSWNLLISFGGVSFDTESALFLHNLGTVHDDPNAWETLNLVSFWQTASLWTLSSSRLRSFPQKIFGSVFERMTRHFSFVLTNFFTWNRAKLASKSTVNYRKIDLRTFCERLSNFSAWWAKNCFSVEFFTCNWSSVECGLCQRCKQKLCCCHWIHLDMKFND